MAALLLGQIALASLSQHGAAPAGCHHLHGAGAGGLRLRRADLSARTDGSSYQFGWIFLVLTVPVVGAPVYDSLER